jgi:glycosyltransferase involved in cell wall biosynthesis
MTSPSSPKDPTPFVSIVIKVDSGQEAEVARLIGQLQQQTLTRWQLLIVELASPTATGTGTGISSASPVVDLSEIEGEDRVTRLTVGADLTDHEISSPLLATAAGRYICTLRIGETLHETYLEKAVLALEALPHVDVLASHVVLADQFDSRYWNPEPLSWPQIRYQPDFPRTAVIRAEALATLTTSWLKLVTGSNEEELWLQLASQGSQSFIIPEPLASQATEQPEHPSRNTSWAPPILQEIEPTSAVPTTTGETIPELTEILSACTPSDDLAGGSRPVILVSDLATDRMPGFLALMLARGLAAVGSPPVVIATDRTREVTNSGHLHPATAFFGTTPFVYEILHLHSTDRQRFIEEKATALQSQQLINIGSQTCYRYLNQSTDTEIFSSVVDVLWEAGVSLEQHLECQELFTHLVVTYDRLGFLASGLGADIGGIREIPLALTPSPRTHKKPLGGRKLVVGWLGNFTGENRPDYFLELAKSCSGLAEFRMAGNGRLARDIRKSAEAVSGLDVSGFPTNRDDFLNGLDLLVTTDQYIGLSDYGGYSTTALEALAHGVPVIAGCSGGLAELLRHTGSGVAVSPRDYAPFEVALRWLLTDLNALEHMQQSARAVAADDAEERMARSYLDIKDGTLAGLEHRKPEHNHAVSADTATLLRAASAGVENWNSQLITQTEDFAEIVTDLQSRRAAFRLLVGSALLPIRQPRARRKARRATSTR